MFRRATTAIAASAVVLAGLTFSAAPSNSAVTGATITPSSWTVGTSVAATIAWTEGAPRSTAMVRSPFPWGNTYAGTLVTPGSVNATVAGGPGATPPADWTLTCPYGVFTLPQASTVTGTIKCKSANSPANPNFFTAFWVEADAGGGNSLSYTGAVQVVLTASAVTAPANPRRDTWIIGQYSTANTADGIALAGNVEVATTAIGLDGQGPQAPPPVRLDFDGNGGTCSPEYVEGPQDTWGTALTADKCTNGSRRLAFFSTSPTAASGATNVAPGGPIYFLQANRLYAIWAADPPSSPSNVVATPGLNSVTVSWTPPNSNGGDPIRLYNVRYKATTDTNFSTFCNVNAATFQCKAAVPATNTQYTFVVSAANQVGRSESAPSSPVSPYDFKDVTASRGDVLFGLGGTKVDANGAAPGLAGQALNVQFKVGSAAEWTTVANGVKVNAESRFSWSRKFPASANKKAVTVRFTYGTDAVSGTYVLPRGGGAGDLSAPRNIKAKAELNKISLTWDPPKFDGGAKVIGYTICAQYIGTLCRDVGPATQGDFRNLLPGAEYSFTVAARTAAKTGPKGKANKAVTFTEASVRVLEREPGLVTTEVKGKGFKDGAKFRVEVAIVPTNGRPRDTWRWDEIREFTADRSFAKAFGTELGSSYDDQTIAVRLVTPLGSVYSRASRPPR